jgi:hypothetical protein
VTTIFIGGNHEASNYLQVRGRAVPWRAPKKLGLTRALLSRTCTTAAGSPPTYSSLASLGCSTSGVFASEGSRVVLYAHC